MPLVREFDYPLPEDRIAQHPPSKREDSRLLVLRREPFQLEHRGFPDIVEFFRPGDVLVLNETKVIKARLRGVREDSGGKIEVLLTDALDDRTFLGVLKPARRGRLGARFRIGPDVLEVQEVRPDGKRRFRAEGPLALQELLDGYGEVPLPPYIRRQPAKEDLERYQTVYARVPGSIAAPTAGFHFTREILDRLLGKGVILEMILLHVGLGTFKPIRTERVEDHRMEREFYEIPERTREEIRKARREGKRVFACGTTGVRGLESWAFREERISGWTDLFIYPPYDFQVVTALITNFHLPRSTPLMLVSSFAGKDHILTAYREAIRTGYRFFSYGDAMLLL
jgi:S-adenosylmethionine:tRNA ribosyltransferase-isomerase